MSETLDPLEQDQEDFGARLSADSYFANIPVLVQRRGITESDVQTALSVLNSKLGAVGAVAIVLMSRLEPDETQGAAPRYFVKTEVQVITQPLFNLGDSGTGKSTEQIAGRVRKLLHRFTSGISSFYMFASMLPVPVADGQVSYGVTFSRPGGDERLPKVQTPVIAPDSGAAPQEVTLACATGGAAIYFTTDGSYPASTNASAILYTGAIAIDSTTLLRAAAELADYQQSDIAAAQFS